jgi:hypothetical protein
LQFGKRKIFILRDWRYPVLCNEAFTNTNGQCIPPDRPAERLATPTEQVSTIKFPPRFRKKLNDGHIGFSMRYGESHFNQRFTTGVDKVARIVVIEVRTMERTFFLFENLVKCNFLVMGC